jgi:phosphoglycerate dehydrogenase-like enzyme
MSAIEPRDLLRNNNPIPPSSESTIREYRTGIKTASVCGLAKLGACIAATLAARGFEVVGVDIDQEKVKKINEGLAPLDEPLLPKLSELDIHDFVPPSTPEKPLLLMPPSLFPRPRVYQTEVFPTNFC